MIQESSILSFSYLFSTTLVTQPSLAFFSNKCVFHFDHCQYILSLRVFDICNFLRCHYEYTIIKIKLKTKIQKKNKITLGKQKLDLIVFTEVTCMRNEQGILCLSRVATFIFPLTFEFLFQFET